MAKPRSCGQRAGYYDQGKAITPDFDFPVPFIEEIVSIDGAHFHFFIPRSIQTSPSQYAKELASNMTYYRDIVSYSWEFDYEA